MLSAHERPEGLCDEPADTARGVDPAGEGIQGRVQLVTSPAPTEQFYNILLIYQILQRLSDINTSMSWGRDYNPGVFWIYDSFILIIYLEF